jgi:hypothetical protein
MMRALRSAGLALGAALMLAACGGESGDTSESGLPESGREGGQAAAPAGPRAGEPRGPDSITPMEERVATLGLLNKRNNLSEDIELRPGESREIGPVIVSLSACERTAPWELPQETGAFVQVDVLERGDSDHTRVFSGWLFEQSPSLNVVEHPIYDVWVKDCAMRFPGEDGDPSEQ